MREQYQRHKKKRQEYMISYRSKNVEKLKEMHKRRYLSKKEKIISDVKRYIANRSKVDSLYKLKRSMRSLVSTCFRSIGVKKTTKTEVIIGCSFHDFKLHIERQFLPGMTWDNRSQWHIDHIVPLATAKTEADVIALNHFTNLRPLWAIDNLKKGSKVEYLL